MNPCVLALLCLLPGEELQESSKSWHFTPPFSLFAPVPWSGGPLRPPERSIVESGPDGHVYAASWVAEPVGGTYDIYVRAKEPNGPWGPPVKVSNERWWLVFGGEVRLAVAGNNTLVVAWAGSAGAAIAWSTDFGRTFRGPVDVSQGIPGLDIGVAFDGSNRLHVLWSGVDAQGVREMFYTYSLGSAAGSLGGIDPGRFAPMWQLTNDAGLQDQPSIAADRSGHVYMSWLTSIPSGAYLSEGLIVRPGRDLRFRTAVLEGEMQVNTSPGGYAAFLYSRQGAHLRVAPYLILALGSEFVLERPVPTHAYQAGGGAPRSIEVCDDGTIAVALGCSDKVGANLFTELTLSRDHGRTFTDPVQVPAFQNDLGHWETVRPSLTVDPRG
ncbi:MAG: hypothetical protein U1E76_20080 [Planctomycetota bacterium]